MSSETGEYLVFRVSPQGEAELEYSISPENVVELMVTLAQDFEIDLEALSLALEAKKKIETLRKKVVPFAPKKERVRRK